MFHFKLAYLKLTLFYVLIVMAISAVFSISIYRLSSNEIDRGLDNQTRVLRDISMMDFGQNDQFPNFDQLRLDQLNESNSHLRMNLIYFNLLILLLSSGASYLFAKKTLEPIEEAMSAQNRFTADASHELRTPLTAMRSEIEVSLRDKKLDLGNAKKLLGSNLEEIEKLEALSNSLLKLARFEEDDKMVLSQISLEEVIVEAYEKVSGSAEKKKIRFENHLKDIQIAGDRQSLTELFVILLDNAIKYSPEKSKINITIERDNKHAVVRIKDRGIGIKASEIPYLFNRFYRADTSRSKEKINGYGLGLSIAKRIVELHKGEISALSKPGKGSEFVVKI